MGDIVERLRLGCNGDNDDYYMEKAADLIERLKGDIQILKLQRDATHFSRCPRCNTKPRAEWCSSTDSTALDDDVE